MRCVRIVPVGMTKTVVLFQMEDKRVLPVGGIARLVQEEKLLNSRELLLWSSHKHKLSTFLTVAGTAKYIVRFCEHTFKLFLHCPKLLSNWGSAWISTAKFKYMDCTLCSSKGGFVYFFFFLFLFCSLKCFICDSFKLRLTNPSAYSGQEVYVKKNKVGWMEK